MKYLLSTLVLAGFLFSCGNKEEKTEVQAPKDSLALNAAAVASTQDTNPVKAEPVQDTSKKSTAKSVNPAEKKAEKAAPSTETINEKPQRNAVDPLKPSEGTNPPPKVKGIRFSETEYKFGDIHEDDKVEHTFVMTNATKQAVTIQDVKVSCGCTAADYSFEPIPPGGKTDIKVVFDSKGKVGMQKKTITVKTTAGVHELSMTGMVYDK